MGRADEDSPRCRLNIEASGRRRGMMKRPEHAKSLVGVPAHETGSSDDKASQDSDAKEEGLESHASASGGGAAAAPGGPPHFPEGGLRAYLCVAGGTLVLFR